MTNYFDQFNANPGISPAALQGLALPEKLPSDYIELLESMNGGEGFVGETYLILDAAENLMEYNRAAGFPEFFPGRFVIGSDGGGEAFAIDLRGTKPEYVTVPFIGDENDMIRLGPNLMEFLKRLHNGTILERDKGPEHVA